MPQQDLCQKKERWISGKETGRQASGGAERPLYSRLETALDLFSIIVEIIDLRSFSNLWYWIALAVLWSTASHWVLGVPFDMVSRALRNGGQAEQDLHDLVRIQVNRLLHTSDVSGFFLTGFMFFLVTSLLLLGFYYGVEFAQALVLMVLPMNVVGFLNLATAHRLRAVPHDTEALCRRLGRTRISIQLVGVMSIFVTGIWGMYQNLTIGALG